MVAEENGSQKGTIYKSLLSVGHGNLLNDNKEDLASSLLLLASFALNESWGYSLLPGIHTMTNSVNLLKYYNII